MTPISYKEIHSITVYVVRRTARFGPDRTLLCDYLGDLNTWATFSHARFFINVREALQYRKIETSNPYNSGGVFEVLKVVNGIADSEPVDEYQALLEDLAT